MTITSLDLPAIVADHKQWLADPATGKRANLSGVDLSRANLICGGKRSDGHDFYLIRELSGAVMVEAGFCRYFTPDEARAHWTETRAGTRLGNESLAIVDHLMRMAEIAGWFSEGG